MATKNTDSCAPYFWKLNGIRQQHYTDIEVFDNNVALRGLRVFHFTTSIYKYSSFYILLFQKLFQGHHCGKN